MKRKTKSFVNEAKVLELFKEKNNVAEIIRKTKLSYHVIRTIGRKNGIVFKVGAPKTAIKDGRNEEIAALIKNGVTLSELGEKYEISRERIRQIGNLYGINKRKDSKLYYQNLVSDIEIDIKSGFSYEEIVEKYKIDKRLLAILIANGLPPLGTIFKKIRNKIILEEYKSGKSANDIINSDNKFLNGKGTLTRVDTVYLITTDKNVYRNKNIRNRNSGGCFDDRKVLHYIVYAREKKKMTYVKIANTLNEQGVKTVSGKEFTQPNTQMKYVAFKKLLEKEKNGK